MKTNQLIKLDNGPLLVLCQDTSKHVTTANLIVKFGGLNKEVIIDGQKYKTEDGVAHFLEHLLIDHSCFGNAFNFFRENYVETNGITMFNATNFYITTVHDFEDNLVKLIEMINIPNFTQEDIDDSKKVILEEIRKSYDQNFKRLNALSNKNLFKNINFLNNLGTEEFIGKMDYDTIKFWYDVFYQPNNQVIAISGNFDALKIKELIENTYKGIDHPIINYQLPNFNEPAEVRVKEDSIKLNTNEEFTLMSFKVDISKFSSYDKVKLSFYLNYFLAYNFGSVSEAYKYIMENKISTFGIECNDGTLIDRFMIVTIGIYTNKKDEFIKLVNDTLAARKMDEEDFEFRRKRSIISLILREEHPNKALGPFVDNILSFGYEKMDTIEDIENFTFADYERVINELDFSNYTVSIMEKNES